MRHCAGTCEYLVGSYYVNGVKGTYLYACKKNQFKKYATQCVSSGQRIMDDGSV